MVRHDAARVVATADQPYPPHRERQGVTHQARTIDWALHRCGVGPFLLPGLRQRTESHATGRKPKMRNTIKKIALTVTAVAAIGRLAACGESAEAGKPAHTAKIGRASCGEGRSRP